MSRSRPLLLLPLVVIIPATGCKNAPRPQGATNVGPTAAPASTPIPTASASPSASAKQTAMRGVINHIRGGTWCWDYYDVQEPDSSLAFLQKRGFHGGGPSWRGIVHGLVALQTPRTLAFLDFDDEAEGLRVCSRDRTSLERVGQLVFRAKQDEAFLLKAVARAQEDGEME